MDMKWMTSVFDYIAEKKRWRSELLLQEKMKPILVVVLDELNHSLNLNLRAGEVGVSLDSNDNVQIHFRVRNRDELKRLMKRHDYLEKIFEQAFPEYSWHVILESTSLSYTVKK